MKLALCVITGREKISTIAQETLSLTVPETISHNPVRPSEPAGQRAEL